MTDLDELRKPQARISTADLIKRQPVSGAIPMNALEKVKSEAAISQLIGLIESHPDIGIRGFAIRALEETLKNDSSQIGQFLPRLVSVTLQDSNQKIHLIEALARVTLKFQEKCKYYNHVLTQTTQFIESSSSTQKRLTTSFPVHITYDLREANIGNWAENQYGTQQTTQIQRHPAPSQPPETPQ